MSISLCVAALVSGALALDGDCPYGVNAHQASDAQLAQAAAAGIPWVRMDFNWFQFEPAKGSHDWSVADRFIDGATAQGLQVFASVAYTPDWAVGQACNNADENEVNWCLNKPPANTGDWTDFVAAAVDRYGDRVKHWGLWNEPNLSHFYDGDREGWVDRILVPGAQTVHDTCNDCLVLGPELANLREANWDSDEGICVAGECIFNGWEVSLGEILKDAGDHIDIVTHHKYSDTADEWLSELVEGQWLIVQYMHGLKEITDAEAPGKPVWLTEFGQETTPGGEFSPAEAAAQLTAAFAGAEALRSGVLTGVANQPWPELEKLFWYDLVDDPNTYDWGEFTWGLLDADGNPKDAHGAYADLIADGGGCADPVEEPEDTGTGPTEPQETGSLDTADETSDSATETDSDPEPEAEDGSLPADPELADEWSEGCGCRVSGTLGLGWLTGLVLGTLVLRRRRSGLHGVSDEWSTPGQALEQEGCSAMPSGPV